MQFSVLFFSSLIASVFLFHETIIFYLIYKLTHINIIYIEYYYNIFICSFLWHTHLNVKITQGQHAKVIDLLGIRWKRVAIGFFLQLNGYINETLSVSRATGRDVFYLIYECKRSDKSTLLSTPRTKTVHLFYIRNSHVRVSEFCR